MSLIRQPASQPSGFFGLCSYFRTKRAPTVGNVRVQLGLILMKRKQNAPQPVQLG